MIEKRYKKHKTKIDLSMHPKYIQDKIRNLEENQFGFDVGSKINIINQFIQNF